MFAFTYVAATLAIAFAVSAVTFSYRRRTPLWITLSCYLLSVALWIGGNAVADVSYTPEALIAASQVAYAAGMASIFFFLVLVDMLVDRKLPPPRRLLLYGIPNAAIMLLAFSPYAIIGMAFPAGRPAEIMPGFPYTLTLIVLITALAYGINRFCRGLLRETDYTRRMQLLYVLSGLIVTALGQLFFDVALPLLGETRFYSLGPITSLFFALGAIYAITRHKLLDIRVVVQTGLVYSILLAAIIGCYVLLVSILSLFLESTARTSTLMSAGATTVLGVISAPLIERYFRRLTDRIFFKDRPDYAKELHVLSEILHTALTFETLVSRTEERLMAALRAEYVRIALGSSAKNGCRDALTIPITTERADVGRLCVGPKRSGDPYTSEDIQFLNTFAYQAATALSRVRLYKEVRRHARELKQKVRERTQELNKAQEDQRQMMIDISHNLQTPLAVLKTRLERTSRTMLHDGERHAIEESLNSLSDFIYDLLSLATIGRSLEMETFRTFSLSALVADVVEEITIIAEGHGIKVASSIAPDIQFRGSEKRMREALINLASNAVKYMGDKKRRVISFSLVARAKHIALSVTDTGVGIDPNDLPHIFDRFYRVEPRNYDAVRSTGLGLAITKRIVDEHDGTITVESTLGKGSRFMLTFPLSEDPIRKEPKD